MFKPQYKLTLKKSSFPPDQAICLGPQLIALVNFLKNILLPHAWYGADIDARGPAAPILNQHDFRLRKIGVDSDLVKHCEGVEQFIWGVFLCIHKRFEEQNFQQLKIGTEDEPFRDVDLNGVLLEIRAFDTSFFEIYSQDEVLINKLAKHFGSTDVSVRPS